MRRIIYLLIVSFVISGTLSGQTLESNPQKNWILGVGTTVNAHRFVQGNNSLYTELTIDYKISSFFSAGVYLGYQNRSYLFPAATPSGGRIYSYKQDFFPVGIRGTFYITSFINENFMQGKMKSEKWDIYLTYLGGAVFNKVTEEFERSNLPEDRIDYSFFKRDEDISYNMGILTGVTYYPVKNFGLFVEFGLGTMGNLNMGIKSRF
ncbi:hypothetical protein [Algoriphagus sp. NG3]|uniref:hypothetical protein n=1 Tax=unclassified Algoriphagus TaxID=2641541 RepID=UPI002A80ED8B|nr:hypothetical protein [Algoriphagus sp. NG3]WPR77725.1 hypothetical protein SLW71_10255 [Algoriphagus sp. NG3]